VLSFRQWLEATEIPKKAIKIALPKVRQQRNWSCGHQAFRAICKYFNLGPEDEKDYIKLLGGNSKDGLPPERIVKVAKKLDFRIHAKTGMTVEDIKNFLDHGIPVICAMQAWGEPKYYKSKQSGHYVVAIGYDKKKMYFEDPSIDGGKRGFLLFRDFDERWHDKDAHGHDCDHMGIALWTYEATKPQEPGDQAKKIQ
jgi:predicted double-glycine peptidase